MSQLENKDWTLHWTGLDCFFLSCFSIFSKGGGGGGGDGLGWGFTFTFVLELSHHVRKL